jgi:hypothetical protein
MSNEVHAAGRKLRNGRATVALVLSTALTTAIIGVAAAAVVPMSSMEAGASSPFPPDHPCTLLSSQQAAKLFGTTVSVLSGRGTCIYSKHLSSSPVASGQYPSIEILTSTTPQSLTTAKVLLDPKKITYVGTVPKGLNVTRHFVTIEGHRAVYTLQGNPALVRSSSAGLMPQANVSTIADRATVEIIVTGLVQPQEVAQRAMADVLSHA